MSQSSTIADPARRFAAHAFRLAVCSVIITVTGCLPIPDRIRDTPEIHGQTVASGRPLVGVEVAALPMPSVASVPPSCEAAPVRDTTTADGVFDLPAHRHWMAWTFLLGESPEWYRAWWLCVRAPHSSRGWAVLYKGRGDMWVPIELVCDTASAWKIDSSTSTEGRCTTLPNTAERYAVYSAVIDSFYVHDRDTLQVESMTWPVDPVRMLGDTSAMYRMLHDSVDVSDALWADFARANADSEPLCDCFRLRVPVRLVPRRPPPRWLPTMPDSVLHGYHPGPVGLSGVGFSADGRRAMVAVGRVCGVLCSSFHLLLLEKRDGRWVVARTLLTGAS